MDSLSLFAGFLCICFCFRFFWMACVFVSCERCGDCIPIQWFFRWNSPNKKYNGKISGVTSGRIVLKKIYVLAEISEFQWITPIAFNESNMCHTTCFSLDRNKGYIISMYIYMYVLMYDTHILFGNVLYVCVRVLHACSSTIVYSISCYLELSVATTVATCYRSISVCFIFRTHIFVAVAVAVVVVVTTSLILLFFRFIRSEIIIESFY